MELGPGTEFNFSVVKKMAGQGSLYLRIKRGFEFIYQEHNDGEDSDGEELEKICLEGTDEKCSEKCAETVVVISDDPEPSSDEPVPSSSNTPWVANAAANADNTHYPHDVLLEEIVEKNLSDPVEILRFLQEQLVKGRPIDAVDDISPLEGDTNYMCVDRSRILETTFAEFESITDFCTTFEVDFMGEQACDKGGPRKEWIRLMNSAMRDRYFANGLREYLANDYYHVGVMMGIALLQNGQLPTFLPPDLVDKLSEESDNKCIIKIQEGLNKFGLARIFERMPQLLHLLRPCNISLSAAMLLKLLKPVFSPEGSTAHSREKEVYACFVKYVRQVASGRREPLRLSSILIFVTGAAEEPVLGFTIHPTITFTYGATFQKTTETEESVCYIPTAHTCTNTLVLPRGPLLKKLPTEQEMFELFDLAFSNDHFGIV